MKSWIWILIFMSVGLFNSITAVEVGNDEACVKAQADYDKYSTLLASGYLTLLQKDYEVSQKFEAYVIAKEAAKAQAFLVQEIKDPPTQYTAQELAEAEALLQELEQDVAEALQALNQAEQEHQLIEQDIRTWSLLRLAAEAYLNEHCGGVDPGPGPISPEPDPGF